MNTPVNRWHSAAHDLKSIRTDLIVDTMGFILAQGTDGRAALIELRDHPDRVNLLHDGFNIPADDCEIQAAFERIGLLN